MSDVDIRSKVENKKPRKKHVITDGHREAMKANLDKARKVRTQKCAERKLTKNEDAILLKELIAEKKRLKNQTLSDSDSSPRREASFPSSQAPNLEQSVKMGSGIGACDDSDLGEDQISSESEVSEESESESEESQSESEPSSDDDAEFVLTRKKAIAKKPTKEKVVAKKPAKKEKESMLAKMEQMTAELAALKKQKKKSSKVNVYVNQEKPKRSAEQQKALLDL